PRLASLQVGAGFGPASTPGITDEGVKLIGDMPNLALILFHTTSITDKSRDSLSALPRLQQVTFNRSPGVTEQRWTFRGGG
ncbi:MAG TPA: hypothetical protein VGG30_07505, partial [Pirellulales bacterium]